MQTKRKNGVTALIALIMILMMAVVISTVLFYWLTRIQNQAENGAADLTSVTKGNYSGHQIPLSVKFTPTNWNGFYFTGRGVIPAAGNVQRSSLGAGLGHNKYGSLTFTYEKSEADVGNQELSNAGYFLTLDLKTEGNNLLPQRREIYPDLR